MTRWSLQKSKESIVVASAVGSVYNSGIGKECAQSTMFCCPCPIGHFQQRRLGELAPPCFVCVKRGGERFPKFKVIFRTRGLLNCPLIVKMTWNLRNPMLLPYPLSAQLFNPQKKKKIPTNTWATGLCDPPQTCSPCVGGLLLVTLLCRNGFVNPDGDGPG